jgi:hypothetical protein
MPSVFQSRFARTGFPHLLKEFGEDAVFGTRSIRVLVERNPPAVYDETGTAYLSDFVIRCYNSTEGILISEINRGVSQLTLAKQTMLSATVTLTIVDIELQGNGVLQLRLR